MNCAQLFILWAWDIYINYSKGISANFWLFKNWQILYKSDPQKAFCTVFCPVPQTNIDILVHFLTNFTQKEHFIEPQMFRTL